MAEVWASLERECPRRIIGELHACGKFEHGTSPRFPGKVLCCGAQSPKPAGWEPTDAQRRARQGGG